MVVVYGHSLSHICGGSCGGSDHCAWRKWRDRKWCPSRDRKWRQSRALSGTMFCACATGISALVGESRACTEHTSDQGHFRPRDFITSSQKPPLGADIAQLPVAHAHNIVPDRACDWRHFRLRDWRHFRSHYFRSCAMVRSTARSTANMTWAVSI